MPRAILRLDRAPWHAPQDWRCGSNRETGRAALFKVGAIYRNHTSRERRDSGYTGCKIVVIEMPLIKIETNGDERILNTGSLCFVAVNRDE